MGEVKSALNVHLSSTDRSDSTVQDMMARNEVSLLRSLYAYQVLHGLRRVRGFALQQPLKNIAVFAGPYYPHASRLY